MAAQDLCLHSQFGLERTALLRLAQREEGDGSRDKDGRERSKDNTKTHRKGKTLDALATKEEDAEQHDERRERGVDGAGKGLVDAVVEQTAEVLLRVQVHVLADSVEHHYLVVNRITDNGEDGTDEGLVDLQREGHESPQQRVESDDDGGVDGQCHSGTYRESDVAETNKNVDEDRYQGEEYADDGSVGDVFRYRWAYFRTADDGTALTDIGVFEGFDILLRNQSGLLQCVVEDGFGLVVHCWAIALYLIVGRDTNRLMVSSQCQRAGGTAREGIGEDGAHLLGLNLR